MVPDSPAKSGSREQLLTNMGEESSMQVCNTEMSSNMVRNYREEKHVPATMFGPILENKY